MNRVSRVGPHSTTTSFAFRHSSPLQVLSCRNQSIYLASIRQRSSSRRRRRRRRRSRRKKKAEDTTGRKQKAMPPQGFKRSRALWDETRRLARERNSTKEYVVAYGRAIMYELQPIRWTTTNRKMLERVVNSLRSCLGMIAYCGKNFPRFLQAVWEFLKGRTKQQWKIVFGIILYYFFIRWIHGYVRQCEMCLLQWWVRPWRLKR